MQGLRMVGHRPCGGGGAVYGVKTQVNTWRVGFEHTKECTVNVLCTLPYRNVYLQHSTIAWRLDNFPCVEM